MPLYNSEREELTEVSKHQLRHSFDFLVKTGLVKPEGGVPGGLCALSEHLHFAEPSNFALVALLQSGALHDISISSDERPWDTVAKELLTVLAFLFCRQRLHPSIAADKKLIEG